MGEIVWAKTQERRDHIENQVYGQLPADSRMTVFASKDKVCLVDSTMLIGANRNSDKKYYQWRSVSSTGFFRNKAGHLQPYRAIRPLKQKVWKSYYPESAFYMLEEADTVAGEPIKAFREACKQYLRVRSVYDVYPMSEVMGMPERFNLLPANLRPFMRTTDWNEFMVGAFGKTRVTPGMIKSAQETEPFVIALAREFRGMVSDVTLRKFIANTHFDDEMMDDFRPFTPRVRSVLKHLDDRSKRRLIGEPINLKNVEFIRYVSNRNTAYSMSRKITGPLSPVEGWMGLTRQV